MSIIKLFLYVFLILSQLSFGPFVLAEMNSGNFKIKFDSLNVGGRDYSSSSNFFVEDTAGEQGSGQNRSNNFSSDSGYRGTLVVDPLFSFSLSTPSCALGTLTTTTIQTCSYVITTSTNAFNGYVTTLTEDGNLRTNNGAFVNDIVDGVVTVGVEEYGIGLTGTHRAFTDDRALTSTALIIASSAVAVSNSVVTITNKASISALTEAGLYSQIISVTSTSVY